MERAARARSVAEDHAALRATGHLIADLVDGRKCACGCAGDPGSCRCLLEHMRPFAARLREHFSAEEGAWKRDDELRGNWASRRAVEGLEREHKDFRERLDRIELELARAADPTATPCTACATAIRGLLADLLEHELSEARLFQRTVFEELGGALD